MMKIVPKLVVVLALAAEPTPPPGGLAKVLTCPTTPMGDDMALASNTGPAAIGCLICAQGEGSVDISTVDANAEETPRAACHRKASYAFVARMQGHERAVLGITVTPGRAICRDPARGAQPVTIECRR